MELILNPSKYAFLLVCYRQLPDQILILVTPVAKC